MNLYTYCKSCKSNINIKSSASTRPDLQMEKGEEFNVNCQNCGHVEKKYVNDIKAESSKIVMFIGLVIAILATIILWISFRGIALAVLVIPILFWQQQMSATKSFNSYMIRRK
ncbi:hypothetical protein A8C32_16585 [Flavivirga aquatica]|uniref:Uncharacterized protein n=1 Tax=Flavivirga aquatica TaxID=1849968 RepID=A0A1E5T8M1_9FLAO|nr:hypothetical protein [Flavivirga aquatica]OEK07721.1 hypothetical protein A8C32_16585 [Flavivirga aquatica]